MDRYLSLVLNENIIPFDTPRKKKKKKNDCLAVFYPNNINASRVM